MSLDQAKAAISKIKTDSAFRKEIFAISDPGKRIEHLNKAGFQCTQSEFTRIINLDNDFRNDCAATGGEMVINLKIPNLA
ncbi:Nif11-like leader peptide family RiPP precursor [Prosthecochloris sp. N3]|uniref:Nif11-like leader peptide family RiPP n=1 Tax=Prosthecochloris ethylica TaxID=2743976 RepID=A0ABR9XPR1_9CHLB|nr:MULTISPECIES: Nif11-like leader peptide family RiPP precursor [Prosthecochloris]MBF0586269.1 Nif11-like leader peptide family RiPP precursor [Prosthecochloris ethylica]MBF0635975.1 Nif11-like leader peptide family RiPP precursor [Prosthecochloris ethylica]NUK47350.1 Nif11-like leader peptide family natural product precursor [Prosthecochloris ethylica]RNA64906.1 Nif11-like leader peptide family natural product precursor [Prosthecochloris sp. ZM_2]